MITIATHSPYILSALNVLMAASEAYLKDPEQTAAVVPEKYILNKDCVSAYYVREDGFVSDIIDKDIYMVDGTYLDAASSFVEETLDKLNDIICN